MIISIIKKYDGTDITELSATFEDLKDMIESPSSFKKGDRLWKFSSFNNKKRNNSNGLMRYALELDFDSGMTIERFENRYKSLEYYLYTTPNHTKEFNKFRVILPIEPEKYSILNDSTAKRKALCQYFKGLDSTCISNFQNVPCLTDSYYFRFNVGSRRFSWKVIQSQIAEAILKAPDKTKQANSVRKPQKYIDKVVESLKAFGKPLDFSSSVSNSGKIVDAKGLPKGSDYFMFRFVSELHSCGLSQSEIISIFESNFRPTAKRQTEFAHKIKEIF